MRREITVDSARLDKLLRELARVTGGQLSEVVRDETRLALKSALRILPPKSKNIGEATIQRDLRKVFLGVSDSMHSRVGPGEFAFFLKGESRKRVFVKPGFKLQTQGELKEMHQSLIRRTDNRGGFGISNYQKRFLHGKGGDDYWLNRYFVRRSDLDKYKLTVMQNVGLLRSPWAKAMKHLGGNAASWMTRHSPKAGNFIDMLFENATPTFTVWTTAPGNSVFRRALIYAFNGRAKAIAKKLKLIASGIKVGNRA